MPLRQSGVGPTVQPVMKVWKSELDRVAQVCDPKYPVIATTFRVTEHWQAGPMSRNLTWQAEMVPEMFVEISPTLAKAKGIKAGDWVKVKSVRGEVMARANVTRRVAPFTCGKSGSRAPWRWWPCPGTSGLPA